MAQVSDDFERSDEDVDASANWTDSGDWGSPRIVSTVVTGDGGGDSSPAWWTGDAFGDPQFAEITVTSAPSGAQAIGALVRGAAGADGEGYYGGYDSAEEDTDRRIYEWSGGTKSSLATEAVAVANADVLRLEADGTGLELFVNTVSELNTTDASFGSGEVGFFVQGAITFDDWSGGDLLAYSVEQTHFRWREDDADEDEATWDGEEDVGITAPASTTKRLRVQVEFTDDPPSLPLKLQYRVSGGSWADVPVAS